MNKSLLSLTLLLAASFYHAALAQPTGDFYIGFPATDTLLASDSVHLHFHVPATYTPANPAKLIVGIHGLGNPQTPEQIRNYFSPAADSIYAIVLCPKPYISPPLNVDHPRSRAVINIAIDSVLQWYAIDTAEMYLAGYSAGSDIASRYLLEDHTHQMKGLIWYAPGFYHDPPLSGLSEFPATCLCYGDQDLLSNALDQIAVITDSFAQTSFDFFYNEIPGIAHTMEFPRFTTEMLECFRFFDDPQSFVPDTPYVGIGIVESSPLLLYPNPATGTVFFKHKVVNPQAHLQVTDLSGKMMIEAPLMKHVQEINLSDHPAGTYIVTLFDGNTSYRQRVVLLD